MKITRNVQGISICRRVALLCGVTLGFAVQAQAATYTSVSAPSGEIHNGAPVVINANGVLAATYSAPQPCPCLHGMIRAADGTVTSFDAPNAFYTIVESINTSGAIAGFYKPVGSNLNRSFIRNADGTAVTFDPTPGALINSYAMSINNAGVVTGHYQDYAEPLPRHTRSYIRAADGTITIFDVPNVIEAYAMSINDAGVVTGSYRDAAQVWHGFVRAANGAITTFDAKNGNISLTLPRGLSLAGDVVGTYADSSFDNHGFLRAPDGKIDRFDVLHMDETEPTSISPNGTVTGSVGDATGQRGFVREPGKKGNMTTFETPFGFAATPTSIVDDGTIAGWYWDPVSNSPKAFIRKP